MIITGGVLCTYEVNATIRRILRESDGQFTTSQPRLSPLTTEASKSILSESVYKCNIGIDWILDTKDITPHTYQTIYLVEVRALMTRLI